MCPFVSVLVSWVEKLPGLHRGEEYLHRLGWCTQDFLRYDWAAAILPPKRGPNSWKMLENTGVIIIHTILEWFLGILSRWIVSFSQLQHVLATIMSEVDRISPDKTRVVALLRFDPNVRQDPSASGLLWVSLFCHTCKMHKEKHVYMNPYDAPCIYTIYTYICIYIYIWTYSLYIYIHYIFIYQI